MSDFLSLIGWTFLPNLVTGWVQSIYYGIAIRAGDRKPRPGTPRFAEDRRRIHILVVSLYLIYTIYEADHELRRAGSFYADLGLAPDVSDRDIKTRFRRLAALHHPDKAAAGTDQAVVNAYFVHLKTAADTLLDPARRFAYERFGPAVLGWARCVTVRDYVVRGAQVLVPYYAVAAAAMYVLGLLGFLDGARYERWLVLALLFVFEAHTITRPARPAVFARVVDPVMAVVAPGRPPYLPFQIVSLARKLCVTMYAAFSQIGPLVGADTSGGQLLVGRRGGDDVLLKQGLERLDTVTKSLEADATRFLDMEMAPYAGDEEALGAVRGKVKEWLVQNAIRSDPLVRDTLGRSLNKRTVDAPSAAQGDR